ncbi:uncharacterized protein LOC141588232 [Silene latifolia]|uniref:uncharacterized protein LOC141588232 n=1 Tax=Silene latifolia TaxID=37657 RepID=UPI003D7761DF
MVVITFSDNQFSPLASSSTQNKSKNSKKSTNTNKETVVSSSAVSTQDKNEKQTGQASSSKGPISADARKSKSLGELNGIPSLNLSDVFEAPGPLGWSLRKGGKDIPIMEPIAEETEPVDRLQFSQADIPCIFFVRLQSSECKEALLSSGYYIFDNKPIVIKPWNVDVELVKAKVDVVLVWIKMAGIPLKFWGGCLPKIAGLVGKFVKKDKATEDHVRLSQARVMVEFQVDQALPDKVKFLDETGEVVEVRVEYEWLPVTCSLCKGMGHVNEKCRKYTQKPRVKEVENKPQKVWRPVQKPQVTPPVTEPQNQLFTLEVFPPLVRTVKSTPARIIMRMNKQGGPVVARGTGSAGPFTFIEALNKLATPKGSKIVKWFMQNNGVGLFGLHETKIKPSNLLKRPTTLCDGWSISTNCSWHKGGRIWVLWKPECFSIQFIDYGAQYIHMRVNSSTDGKEFLLTMIYAHNDVSERQALWSFLKNVAWSCSLPWLWLGDFNTVLPPVERLGGNSTEVEMEQFQDCVSVCCMEDVQATGALFTWSNKQDPVDRVYSRLDRAMGNLKWVEKFGDYWAHFHPPGLFDHSPCTLSDRKNIKNSYNITVVLLENIQKELVNKPGFLELLHGVVGFQTSTVPVNVQVVRRGKCCTESHWEALNRPVTAYEVKKALFSTPKDKSPGPDGYNSQFFRDSWDLTGGDVTAAILNFFETRKLLNQMNATLITLIPKVDRPVSVKHFRPITCCNVIYKTISKILCSRVAGILPDIINNNQGAFVQGRSILENILICQDLVRLYNRRNVSPRCMFMLDMQKAYDTIEWGFLDQMLSALNFPEKTRQLIMTCVTSTSFSLNLNGALFGYFKGKRGLRQGDPISPLLFTICMEYLTRVLDYATYIWTFRFHPLCKVLRLNHLLFADDLLLFCKGDTQSIMILLRAFSTFSATSCLKVNAAKSEVVFRGVSESMRAAILQISCFKEAYLPFKYLGIPIQAGRLTKLDCNTLVERVVA